MPSEFCSQLYNFLNYKYLKHYQEIVSKNQITLSSANTPVEKWNSCPTSFVRDKGLYFRNSNDLLKYENDAADVEISETKSKILKNLFTTGKCFKVVNFNFCRI